jgi:hypothetical protein
MCSFHLRRMQEFEDYGILRDWLRFQIASAIPIARITGEYGIWSLQHPKK